MQSSSSTTNNQRIGKIDTFHQYTKNGVVRDISPLQVKTAIFTTSHGGLFSFLKVKYACLVFCQGLGSVIEKGGS